MKKLKPKSCKLKTLFMGTPEIGATVLLRLIENGVKIDFALTRPDKPKGRSGKPKPPPVKQLAEKHQIPVYQPNSKDELTKVLKDIKPDICVVAAFGMIIPKDALSIPNNGMINFHPSLLPKYRGPSPITAPILNGDRKTGVTIIKVTEKMDAGDILAQKKVSLTGTETTPTLSDNLARLGAEMIAELLPQIKSGRIKPEAQDEPKATYTKMLKKEDGKIDWKNMTAEKIERMSRAFTPWPGISFDWKENKVDLYDIGVSEKHLKPGQVNFSDNCLHIGTKAGSVSIGALKIAGKNKINATEFIRGYKEILNTDLS